MSVSVTAERFAQGMTYEEFKAAMTRNRERLEANERGLELGEEDLAPFRALPRPLHVLVLAEDWCGDVIANLPILSRIAAETGTLDLRVFLRDQSPDLIDQYLNNGIYRSIPVFAFFGEDFAEVGVFIERPDSVTELRERRRRELYERHPELGSPDTPVSELSPEVRARVTEELARMRAETKPFADREVVRELRAIVERVLV